MKKINLFLGKNGAGKTNLLDSLYYAAIGKSYFSSKDANIMEFGKEFFRLEARILKGEENYKLEHAIIPSQKKETKINGKAIQKLSELLGLFPTIAIAPKEVYTLLSTSQERRKACDRVIAQYDKHYTTALITYNQLLKRRNTLLKDASTLSNLDLKLIQVLDEQMDKPAKLIYKTRKRFTESLYSSFEGTYRKISNGEETAQLTYHSSLGEGKLSEQRFKVLEADFAKKRTTIGIHKDDYQFSINEKRINSFASQGQLKSFIIAFKLSLYQILREQSQQIPFLLLDDIFDKIDSDRTAALLQLLNSGEYGQIFISDADIFRLPKIMEENDLDYLKVIIENGKVETR